MADKQVIIPDDMGATIYYKGLDGQGTPAHHNSGQSTGWDVRLNRNMRHAHLKTTSQGLELAMLPHSVYVDAAAGKDTFTFGEPRGTQAAPFRTIAAAVEQYQDQDQLLIRLKGQQTHTLNPAERNVFFGSSLTIVSDVNSWANIAVADAFSDTTWVHGIEMANPSATVYMSNIRVSFAVPSVTAAATSRALFAPWNTHELSVAMSTCIFSGVRRANNAAVDAFIIADMSSNIAYPSLRVQLHSCGWELPTGANTGSGLRLATFVNNTGSLIVRGPSATASWDVRADMQRLALSSLVAKNYIQGIAIDNGMYRNIVSNMSPATFA